MVELTTRTRTKDHDEREAKQKQILEPNTNWTNKHRFARKSKLKSETLEDNWTASGAYRRRGR